MFFVLIILIVIIIALLCLCSCNYNYPIRGGTEKYSPVLKRAYIMFMKAQDINDDVIEAESARDFWIADFMFSMANKQFALGYDNTIVGFPLAPNRKIITEIYEDMRIWDKDDKAKLEKKVDETIDIINRDYPTDDIMKSLSKRVIITDYAVDLLQNMYPKISKDSILSLLLRYGSMYTYKDGIVHGHNSRNIYISKALLSIPPELYRFYEKNLPNTIESFASPINHTLDRFCAIFQDDKEFGAIGPFTYKLVGNNKGASFIVNPPYDTTTMDYVSRIIADHIDNNYTVCLPSKDGGLFHLYEGRTIHERNGRHPMNESIDRLLRIPTLSGILIIPAKVMFYWNFFKQKKQRLNYDTIMFFYLKKDSGINTMDFITKVQKILLNFAFPNGYGHQKQIHNIEEKKILELYPMNGQKIIDTLKIKF